MTDQPPWATPITPAPGGRSDAATEEDDRRAALQAALDDHAAATASSTVDEDTCPTCGAPDVNPSGEILPHCWQCGYRSDDWPSTDLAERRRALAMHRLGVSG